MTSIQLDHVTVVRDKAELITDLSLTIHSGEFFVVIGPSGSGKTTLLRAIAGLDKAASGTVLYDGESVNHLSASQRDVAMVFQDDALIPFKTVKQNVAFPLELHGVGTQEIDDRVMAESRVMAIDRFLSRMPRELAAGQRQLVQAARALVRRPNAFLLDEPLARVDPIQRKAMRSEVKLLANGYGVTAVYATNDPTEAMSLGDRIVVLDGGRIRQVGTPADLYQNPIDTFVAAFIGLPSMSFIDGVLTDTGVQIAAGVLPSSAGRDRTGEVIVGVRPHEWEVTTTAGLEGVVQSLEEHGDVGYGVVELGGDAVNVRFDGHRPRAGDAIQLWARRPHLFDRDGKALR